MQVETLTLGLFLYVMPPLWVIAGGLDYWCHRATKIEENAGLVESMFHSAMGFLAGVPMFLAVFFEIDVLVLVICFVFFVAHEIVAHLDVVVAEPKRKISVWEQHTHAYLSTIPFYVMTLVVCRNWDAFIRTITLDWSGHLSLHMRPEPVGTMSYVLWYTGLMFVIAVVPYTEELFRCWHAQKKRASDTA